MELRAHSLFCPFFLFLAPDIAPVNFKATRRGSQASSVLLTWAAIPLQHRNGILTGYAVTAVASFGSDEPREVTVEPELVLFEWTDLTPDTQYNISIAALTVAGRGPIATAQVTLLPRGKLLKEFHEYCKSSNHKRPFLHFVLNHRCV